MYVMMSSGYKGMSFTSLAIVGLFAIIVLLIARAKLRQKDAEMAAMATMMGLQNVAPQNLQGVSAESLQKLSPEVLPPEVARLMANSDPEVCEWSFGDKSEDMTKPGVHFRTNVKIRLFRNK